MASTRWVLLAAAAMAAAAAMVILVTVGPSRPTGAADAASKRFEPVPVRARAFRSDHTYLTAWLQRRAALYNRPGGRVVTSLGERTRWGTPRVLSVAKVRRRGKWLRVRAPSPYGCCVIALSGRQPRIPPGWTGGARLALHGTADTSALGRAVSIGCL